MFNFEEELEKFFDEKMDTNFIATKNDVNVTFQSLNQVVKKLLKKQGTLNIQLEEMYSLFEEKEEKEQNFEKEIKKMLQTLITTADLIEDFYLYYQQYPHEEITPQAQLMWKTLGKAHTEIGLTRIVDEHTPMNAQLNTVVAVEAEPTLPNGYILKVLKSGYLYKGELVRKSTIVVNKFEEV